MTTAATLELIVDSTSVGPAERALDRLAATGAKVEGRLTVDMGNIEKAMAQLAQGMGRLDKTITAGFQRMAPAAAPAVRTFDDLRRAIDPAYAAAQRMAQVSDEVRAAAQREGVAVGQVNGLLEIAASRYLGIATAAEQAEQAQREQAAATASATQNYRALMASLDTVSAADARRAAAEKTLTAAVQAGIITDEERVRALARVSAAMSGMAGMSASVTRGASGIGYAVTGVSYQLQDFAVQVGAGTDAMRAFSMQAPQLLGALGFTGKLALAGSLMGTLIALGTSLIPVLSQMGGVAGQVANALQLMMSVGAAAAVFFAGRFAVSMAVAAAGSIRQAITATIALEMALGATTTRAALASAGIKLFSASLVMLRRAMMLTGIGALIVGAGLLIDKFIDLVRGAGGFGNALGLLKDVAVEVWGRIGAAIDYVQAIAAAAAAGMQAFFLNAIVNISKAFIDMTRAMAAGVNAVFGTNISGMSHEAIGIHAGDGMTLYSGLALAALEADQAVAQANASTEAAREAMLAPLTSLDALTAAMNNTGAAAAGMGGDIGGAGGAASAASQELERLRQAAESLKDGLDPMRAYNRELADLQAMLENGFIDGDQMARAIRNMNIELADTIPMVGSLSDAFGDFVASGFRDWRGFMDAILSTWRSTIASLVSDWARSGLVRILNPGAASATGATGGALGGVAGQALSGIFGSFGTGQGLAGLAGGTGLLGGLGEVIGGLGSGGLSGAFAGLQTALGGGFMSAIGGLIPVVGAAALVISAFRAKTRLLDEGLQVTVSGMDALVESFRRTETSRLFGLIRSRSSSVTDTPAAMADPIIAAVAGIQTGVLDAARALGIGAAAFDGFSAQIKVSTKGMTEEQAAQAVTEALAGLGDEFALMTPGLRALIREGETATGALTRLTTSLAAVNDAADLLGHALLPTSLAGGNLASVMAEAAGGIDAFGRGVTAYFDGFYTAEERLVAQTRRLSVQMADLGLAMPRSRAEFRRMVEGIDTTTEAGAALYGQVMALAGALDGVLPFIAGLTAELAALQGNAQTGLDAAIEAAKSAAQANAAAATDWYRAAGSIREYIDRLRGTAGALTSGAQAQAYNQARYQTTLAAALAGDLKAAQDITDVAETMRQSSLATARTRVDAARTEARILSDLGLLSGVSDIEGARHDVIAGLLGQQVEVMQGARNAIASGAAMTEAQIDALMGQLGSLDDAIAAAELINYAYLRERLAVTVDILADANVPAYLRTLLSNAATGVEGHIDFIVRSSLTPDQRWLALTGASEHVKTIRYLADNRLGLNLTRVAVDTIGTLTKTVNLAVGARLPADVMRLALAGNSELARTVTATLSASIPADAKRLALGNVGAYSVAVMASLSPGVSADVRRIVVAQQGTYAAAITAAISQQMPTEARRILLTRQGGYIANVTGVLVSDMTPAVRTLLLNANTAAMRAVTITAAFSDSLTADERLALSASATTTMRTIRAAIDLAGLSATGALFLAQIGVGAATVQKTVAGQIALAALSADQRLLLSAITETVQRSVAFRATGVATADQMRLLGAVSATILRAIDFRATGSMTADQRAILGAVGATVTRTVRAAFDLSALDSGNVTGRRNLLNAANLGFSSTVIGMADLRALTGDGLALLRAATGTIIRTLRGDVDMSGLTPRQRALLDAITGGAEGRITLGGTFQFDPTTGFRTWFETSSRESIARPMNDLRDAMTPLRAALVALKDALAAEAGRAAQAQRVAALNSYAAGMTRDAAGNLYANDQQLSALAGIAGIGTAGLSGQQIGNRVASFSAMDTLTGIAYDPTGSRARIEAARARVAALYGQITDLMDAYNVTFDGGLSLTSKGALRYKGGAHF